MKTIEEYAIDLVFNGIDHLATDDTNESGEIADEDHDAACALAAEIGDWIRDNPERMVALVRESEGSDPR